ncbi:MAG: SMC-Scp complex subunit ScpB [Bradymonadales bacterium]|nr:MAG: SMC-Scp complex subunit ScpB [Bradymonadales bacterium]
MISKKAQIEGVLFASGQPLSLKVLSELLEISLEETQEILKEIEESYKTEDHGFDLVKVAGGYQFRTKPEMKEWMARFHQKKPPRLTQAMLELLAIVAYKQPVTRPEIDRIRGVDSSGALKTLLERGLIEMRGRSDSVGNPVLYVTTPKFLEWFQVSSLGDLPPLTEIEALDVKIPEEEREELLNLLNRDEGFVNEDLREMDHNLQDIAGSLRELQKTAGLSLKDSQTPEGESPTPDSVSPPQKSL